MSQVDQATTSFPDSSTNTASTSPTVPTANAASTNASPLDLTTLVPAALAGDLAAERKLYVGYGDGIGLPQNYDQAFAWASEAAFQNDPLGENAMAWLYSNGKGVHRNEAKAFTWYLLAAKQGDATAERFVGHRYLTGTGVPRNEGLAVSWSRKAAIQGEPVAKTIYGQSLFNGLGIEKDLKKGFTYLLSAAGEYIPARSAVAQCYDQGLFVPHDPVQAYRWCLLADQKDSTVQTLEQTLKKQLTDEQIKEAQKANDDWAKIVNGEIQTDAFATTFSQGNSITLPFKRVMGHIYMPVKINHEEVNIVIDTGFDGSGLDQRLADKLHLSGKQYLPLMGTGPEPSLGMIAENVDFDLGGLSFNSARVLILPQFDLDQYLGVPIGGILGGDLLRRFVVQIDYANHTITFYDPKVFRADPKAVVLPIEFSHSTPFITATLSNAQAADVKGSFVIDTGDSGTVDLTKKFLDANPALQIKGVVDTGGWGIGGISSTAEGKIAGMSFESLTLHDVIVSVTQAREGVFSNLLGGRIGNGLLSRFEVTIDYPEAKIYLKPNAHFADPYHFSDIGLGVKAVGNHYDRFGVYAVIPRSPASVAGFQKGDVIEQVDKKPAQDLSLDDIYDALGKEGAHEIAIQRDNSRQTLSLNVFDPFKNPEKIPELTGTTENATLASAPIIQDFAVSYIGPVLYNKAVVIQATGLKIGDRCLPFGLTHVLKNLYATGMIENAGFKTKDVPNGVVVNIIVQAAPIVTKVAFNGLTADQEAGIRPLLIAEEGKRITSYDAHQDEQTIQTELTTTGQTAPVVVSKLDEDSDKGEAQVTYTVKYDHE